MLGCRRHHWKECVYCHWRPLLITVSRKKRIESLLMHNLCEFSEQCHYAKKKGWKKVEIKISSNSLFGQLVLVIEKGQCSGSDACCGADVARIRPVTDGYCLQMRESVSTTIFASVRLLDHSQARWTNETGLSQSITNRLGRSRRIGRLIPRPSRTVEEVVERGLADLLFRRAVSLNENSLDNNVNLSKHYLLLPQRLLGV